jgi:hypothetical protein
MSLHAYQFCALQTFADLVHTLSRVNVFHCNAAVRPAGAHRPFLRGLRSTGGSAMAAGSYAYLGEAEVMGAGATLLGEEAGPQPAAALPGEAGGASAAAAALLGELLPGEVVVAAAALEGKAAAAAAAAFEGEAAAAAATAAAWGAASGRWPLRPHHLGNRIRRASLDGLLVAACGHCRPLISKIAD